MIDPTTLYFSAVLVSMTAGLVSFLFGRKNPEFRSVRDWGLATMFIALSTSLVFARGVVHMDSIILVSNTLLIIGMVLTYRAFLTYRSDTSKDATGWSLVVICIITTLLWQAGVVSEVARGAIVTGSMALIMWRIVWLFARYPQQAARRAQNALVLTYFFYALLNTLRTMAVFLGSTNDVLSPNLIETLYITGNTILWISVTLCVIWLVVERQQEQLMRLAMFDPLTGALNRNALLKSYKEEQYRANRSNTSFALLLFDIDFFKNFNDTHGHLIGDQVLRKFVDTLKPIVRQNDHIGRYGGEEFAVIVSEADKDLAMKVAERARNAIETTGVEINGKTYKLTASVGVCVYPQHGRTWDDMVSQADQALYKAKDLGRNRVVSADDAFDSDEFDSREPVMAMRLASET